jgi:signal transduction histidine kinase
MIAPLIVSIPMLVLLILVRNPMTTRLSLDLLSYEEESNQKLTGAQRDLKKLTTEIGELKRASSLSALASQVAHDVRSPLAALEAVLPSLGTLPENQHSLISSAIVRIRDITYNLLRDSAGPRIGFETNFKHLPTTNKPSVEMLLPLIESMVAEKRISIGDKIYIDTSNLSLFEAFSFVSSSDLKRVVSNILDNAIQATFGGDMPVIKIELIDASASWSIRINDNGHGIPRNLLPKIGSRGLSFGKPDGNGLGLYHAFECMREWGGHINIESTTAGPERGTLIELVLPKAKPPPWFTDRIPLSNYDRVVVVDDQLAIHKLWTERLKDRNIAAYYFHDPEEVRIFFHLHGSARTVLLLDYEFPKSTSSGIDVVSEFGKHADLYIVTGRHDDCCLREEIGKLNLKIIPKSYAGRIGLS